MKPEKIRELLADPPQEINFDEELIAALRYYQTSEEVTFFIADLQEEVELCFGG